MKRIFRLFDRQTSGSGKTVAFDRDWETRLDGLHSISVTQMNTKLPYALPRTMTSLFKLWTVTARSTH